MTDMTPTAIQRDGDDAIMIEWSDGLATRWTAGELRKACPCASCREKKRHAADESQSSSGKSLSLPVLSRAEARPLRIVTMRPVGNYAYAIGFSDGHSSGIFKLAWLHDAHPSVADSDS